MANHRYRKPVIEPKWCTTVRMKKSLKDGLSEYAATQDRPFTYMLEKAVEEFLAARAKEAANG